MEQGSKSEILISWTDEAHVIIFEFVWRGGGGEIMWIQTP